MRVVQPIRLTRQQVTLIGFIIGMMREMFFVEPVIRNTILTIERRQENIAVIQ